jgi:hypothetical protein
MSSVWPAPREARVPLTPAEKRSRATRKGTRGWLDGMQQQLQPSGPLASLVSHAPPAGRREGQRNPVTHNAEDLCLELNRCGDNSSLWQRLCYWIELSWSDSSRINGSDMNDI